ncbi:helix-turn-helix transcriptional regulator [Spirosoma sp. KNUC1025]|uniref:ArsR/SmtB family transcription factor n=1 Tax=Spirosoma sp. KNUC1025 TaxID=2894082 RepID=UPI001E42AD17|nr:metalloregulator ArsR/SmtB family transcription factor [Spirosoma sp. KNUC1025]UFH57993.1 metalloregulator ArsR/SmtB family transcription factor [Spirosoma sp. KNUC1025]
MDDIKIGKTAELVKALAHPTRLRILNTLRKQPEINVSDLHQKLLVEPTLLSKHLKVMAKRQILTSRRKGKAVYNSIAIDDLPEAITGFIDRQ